MKFRNIVLSSLLVLGLPVLAQAQSFACISAPANCAVAQGLLTWSLTGNVVTVSNAAGSSNQSFIRNVYFDTPLNTSVSYTGHTGLVTLNSGSNPALLPGGNGSFASDFSWSAANPGSKFGVNAGESISFTLTHITLANFTNGSARIGAHLQGLQGGASASLVSFVTPVSAVPEPESYALLLAGLGLMCAVSRRHRAKRA